MTDSVFVSTRMIADDLEVHITTVQGWVRDGKLKGEKAGTGHRAPYVILRSDYEEFKVNYLRNAKE